jgi:DNA-directed RNA polymerase subunit beta'
MIIGAYYLTHQVLGAEGEGRRFASLWEIERAYDNNEISLHAAIEYRQPGTNGERHTYRWTTPGRVFFEQALPPDFVERFGRVGGEVVGSRDDKGNFVGADKPAAGAKKRDIGEIVQKLSDHYPTAVTAESLDALKSLGFRFATRAGLTVSMDDVKTPPDKGTILDRYEKEAEKIETQFRRGIITDDERRQKEIEIWTNATEEVRRAMERNLGQLVFNPIDMMVNSGARGNIMQVRQIAGMRGLVANPRGEIIPRPIKSNFREGLSVLEYFISTHGARKGLADTALRTADSGYLTRRLVDVAQELIIREDDCGTNRGIWMEGIKPDEPGHRYNLDTRVEGRLLVEPLTLSDGTTLDRNTVLEPDVVARLRDDEAIDRIRVRSVLTCEAEFGVCGNCYGKSLATGREIELGEAVGVIAAQSIGEPGTQLTMRTFHTGGIAGEDITHGLPRVVELFEARSPKGKAVLARTDGVVRIADDEAKGRIVTIVGDDGTEDSYTVATRAQLEVTEGQEIQAGDAIVEGPKDPKELLEIKGIRETQVYLVAEVQKVYRDQGVSIHDKHIELIVRQMLRRVAVQEPGDSEFLPGERVDSRLFAETNRQLVQAKRTPAEGRPELMGITKASLATDSWLSAASFQETTRVLTEAAIEGKSDKLLGLKEDIIIGKLIPAGTGMGRYRALALEAPDYQPMEFWSSDAQAEEDLAAWLATKTETSGGEGGGFGTVFSMPDTEDGASAG